MEQHSSWVTSSSTSTSSKKKNKLPFRGFQKITDAMDEPQRRGAEIWNEMVTKLIEVGEMERK